MTKIALEQTLLNCISGAEGVTKLNLPDSVPEEVASALEEVASALKVVKAFVKARESVSDNGELMLDGGSLSIEDAFSIVRGELKVGISEDAMRQVESCREGIMNQLEDDSLIYGFNTGFGQHQDVPVPESKMIDLQYNLIRSHAIGLGDPSHEEIVRLAMLFRANALLKGYSGVSPDVIRALIEVVNNRNLYPYVPKLGSLGASGDLAPLSHIALTLIGEGDCFYRGDDGEYELIPAGEALKKEGIEPLALQPKDGLALNNGMQFSTAYLTVLADKVERQVLLSTVFGACATEVMMGSDAPFSPEIHEARPHPGQIEAARILLKSMEGSGICDAHRSRLYDKNSQDPYSSRCLPQVIGPFLEALSKVKDVIEIEVNSATDNPLVFGGEAISAGNFHGMPIAMAASHLFDTFSATAKIAEARVRRIVDIDKNRLGASCLISPDADQATSSGMMIVEYTYHAIANRILSLVIGKTASLSSASSASCQEDHVSHAPTVIFSLEEAIDLFNSNLALELAMLSQGYFILSESEDRFRKDGKIAPDGLLKPGKAGSVIVDAVKDIFPPVIEDRYMQKQIARLQKELIESGRLYELLEELGVFQD